MTPEFTIIAAGVDITGQIKDRLLGLSISDDAGLKSDQVEIRLDDRGGAIEMPAPGALIAVAMGYKETGVIPMGIFTADEVAVKGPPDTMTIRGKAAELGGRIKEQKTRAWDDVTISDIVSTIAGEHGLEPKVAEALQDVHYEHLDQTDESDLNFLIRLGRDHDAIASVKGRALLFIPKGEGRTASGLPMLPIVVDKTGETSWAMTLTDREAFASVVATWHDQADGTKKTVTEGSGAPAKRLRHCYATEDEARRAATAELRKAQRGSDKLTITMPGNPLIAAGGLMATVGFRLGVSGLWSIKSVRHDLNGGGFVTKVEAESPNSGEG